jgi:oxalate decarboxylase
MIVSRRNGMSEICAGALRTASAARTLELGDPNSPAQDPQAIEQNPHSGSDPGPENPVLSKQFPSNEMPPSTPERAHGPASGAPAIC